MNMQHIEQLQHFTLWAKKLTGKTTKFSVSTWAYGHREEQSTEYTLWIDDIFSYTTEDLRALMALMPYLKELCNEHRASTETRRLAA